MENVTSKMQDVQLDDASAAAAAGKKFGRRDHLIAIEQRVLKQWEDAKVFESEPDPSKKKYMVTFPYPYMNGYMHVGHLFTITKVEFASRYHRLKGENVVFPFGLHCTGMPIQSAANKLKNELATYGNPPNFQVDEVKPPVVQGTLGMDDELSGATSCCLLQCYNI